MEITWSKEKEFEELKKRYDEKVKEYHENKNKLSKLEGTAESATNSLVQELEKVNPKLLKMLGVTLSKPIKEMSIEEIKQLKSEIEKADDILYSKIKNYLDTGDTSGIQELVDVSNEISGEVRNEIRQSNTSVDDIADLVGD